MLWDLAQRHSIDLGINDPAQVGALFDYSDFAHFIDTFTRCSDCIVDAGDLGLLVDAYAVELDRQGVRYAELHFNPEPHQRRKHIPMAEGLAAMNVARDRARDRSGIELRWIVDGVRDALPGPVAAQHAVNFMVSAGPDSGIVALGLGGNEIGFPARDYASAFTAAREAGFQVVAHAGEARGPESIWETLESLKPARIGHGVAAARDPRLMAHLAEHRVPLEISPTSNVRTGVIASFADLPLQVFTDASVTFSINSDDPPMFGTDLLTEYAIAARLMNLDRQGVARLAASAIDQSFADDGTRARLHRELRAHTPIG
jgi:aminodeoxyfutalosine deaminase